MSADEWRAAWLGAGGIVCLVGPLLAAAAWKRRTGESYRTFGYGAAVFAISQLVLRLPWQIPLAVSIQSRPAWEMPFWAFSGFTAGLFEEVGRYVGYRTWLKGNERPQAAVMFGLGHGGLEAMLLVGAQLLAVAVAVFLIGLGVLTNPRIVDAMDAAVGSAPFAVASAAVVERFAAITLSVGLALVVQQAIVRREIRWLGAAIAIHASVDFLAVLLSRRAQWPTSLVECVLVVAAAATLYLALQLSRRPRAS